MKQRGFNVQYILWLVAAILALLAISGCVRVDFSRPYADMPRHDVRWEGILDIDMLHKAEADLAAAKKKGAVLKVDLISPGGPALISFEIANLVHDYSEKGTPVEIHARVINASGATFILAAGTKGLRYIDRDTVFLVHPPQTGGGFFSPPECTKRQEKPTTEDGKVINTILDLMATKYSEYTGRSVEETTTWLACGDERVGLGKTAVELGIADKLEG